jgi:hypothetical protein
MKVERYIPIQNKFEEEKIPLQTVEITYSDGSTSTTNVSNKVTIDEVKSYFVGKSFDLAAYPKERLVKAVAVKFIT